MKVKHFRRDEVARDAMARQKIVMAAVEWRRARIAACAAPLGNAEVWTELGAAETSLSRAVAELSKPAGTP